MADIIINWLTQGNIQIIKFYLPKNIKACFLAGSVAAGAATFFMPWASVDDEMNSQDK